jgi:hypothetical protein
MLKSAELDAVPDRIKFFLEESVIPSPHSIDLSETPASDYLYRQTRDTPHVAELYLENSKLNPHSTQGPIGSGETFEEIREWFFETAYDLDGDTYLKRDSPRLRLAEDQLPDPMQALLDPFSEQGGPTNLLYSIDMFALYGGRLLRRIPQSPYLWTEREVSAEEMQELGAKLTGSPDEWTRTDAVLFFVACPWRYMMLHGPRGYRHTLLDLGRLLAVLEGRSGQLGLPISVLQNFHDRFINDFVLADGVERSTHAIMMLNFGPPAN